MACRRPGDKPLPEPMVIILLMNIYTSLSLSEFWEAILGVDI